MGEMLPKELGGENAAACSLLSEQWLASGCAAS